MSVKAESLANLKLIRDPDVETSLLPDGHVVLVSSKTEWAHTLTPIAALAWEFCDGTNSVANIVDFIKEIPEISVDATLSEQIVVLLQELVDAGFLNTQQLAK